MADDMEIHNRSKDSATSEVQDVNFNGEKGEGSNAMNTNIYGKQRLDVGTLKQISSRTPDWADVLKRYIRFLPAIAFDANLQASWEAVAVSFQAGLLNGGPTSLVYGTILAWIGSTAIAASLAEMASITPTVGAQYRWTAMYAPPSFMTPAFWGLLQGWITVFAWIATCAQPVFLLGTVIQGLIIFNDETYVPERWHGTLLTWAVLAIPVACNVFARRALAPLEIIGGVTHTLFLILFIVTLAVMAPRSTASFVFTQTLTGLSGWSNVGIQWNIGLLSAVFPLAGFDGVLHMSDEVKDPARKVPQSMVLSVVINGGMALAFMITILFTLGDPETALATPTGYPIIQVLYGATKSKAGTNVIMACLLWNGLIALFSGLASISRLSWAFARDHGLPFPEFFGYVHPRLRIPMNSLILVTTVVGLLQLINIGSTTALYAILSLSTLALYISYVIPIIFFALARFRGDHIPYGPFRLGRWGMPLNLFSIAYGIFIIIWLPFPPYMPVTSLNMNYGGPVVGAVIIFALIDWFIWGKKRFSVPVDKVGVYE